MECFGQTNHIKIIYYDIIIIFLYYQMRKNVKTIFNLYKYFFNGKSGIINGLLMGGTLSYINENKYYEDIPFIIIPLPYVGYQLYKNKTLIIQELKKNKIVVWF